MARPRPTDRLDAAVSIPDLYRSLWRHAAGARWQLVLSMLLLVGSQSVKLSLPWLSAQAINALQRGESDALRQAAGWVGFVILAHVVAWAMHGPGRVLERNVSVAVRSGLSNALYAKLTRAPLAWHERHHSGELQHRIAQASTALYQFAQSQFIYLQSAVNFFGPVIALWLLSGQSGVIALVGYAVMSVAVVRFDRTLMKLAAEENRAERRYAAGLLEFLGHMGTVLSLRLGPSTQRLLDGRLGAVFAPLRRSIALNEAKWFSVDMLSLALTWGLVAAYVWQQRGPGETLLIGSVFMLYQYAQQAGGVLNAMAGHFQSFARTRTDYASADEVWQAPERPEAGAALSSSWRRIELRGIVYRHRGTRDDDDGSAADAAPAAPADADTRRPSGLHGVDLPLRRGQRIALVGPSGSGKSTLLRVLAGLYEPESVQLRVDGAEPHGTRNLGSLATLIPQEADVFEATVRENIGFDDPGTEPVRAIAFETALHASAFDAVLATLPGGLDTEISERGFNLSGGQRQRLGLARGLYAARDSSVLLLDEPTSALDPITEGQVFRRIARTFPDACVIASVHRLSLLQHFDTVVLMQAGRVIDLGAPDAVAGRQPLLRSMLAGAEDAPA